MTPTTRCRHCSVWRSLRLHYLNRPGARFGPRAIRQESFGLETYSPWLDKDLTDCTVFDAGDLELPFGDSEQTLALIREQTATILKGGKRP